MKSQLNNVPTLTYQEPDLHFNVPAAAKKVSKLSKQKKNVQAIPEEETSDSDFEQMLARPPKSEKVLLII